MYDVNRPKIIGLDTSSFYELIGTTVTIVNKTYGYLPDSQDERLQPIPAGSQGKVKNVYITRFDTGVAVVFVPQYGLEVKVNVKCLSQSIQPA